MSRTPYPRSSRPAVSARIDLPVIGGVNAGLGESYPDDIVGAKTRNRLWIAAFTLIAVSIVPTAMYLSVDDDLVARGRDHYVTVMGLAGKAHAIPTGVFMLIGLSLHALVTAPAFLAVFWPVSWGADVAWANSNVWFWGVMGVADAFIAVAVATNGGTRESYTILLIAALVLCSDLYTIRAAHFAAHRSGALYKYAAHIPGFALAAAPWIVVLINAAQFHHDWNDNAGADNRDSDKISYDEKDRRVILASTVVAAACMLLRAAVVFAGRYNTHHTDRVAAYDGVGTDTDTDAPTEATRDTAAIGNYRASISGRLSLVGLAWAVAVACAIAAWAKPSEFENFLPRSWHVGDRGHASVECSPFNGMIVVFVAALVGLLHAGAHHVRFPLLEHGLHLLIASGSNLWRVLAESAVNALLFVVVSASVGANDAMEVFLGATAIVAFSFLLAVLPVLPSSAADRDMSYLAYLILWGTATLAPFIGPALKLSELSDNKYLAQQGDGSSGILDDTQLAMRQGMFAALWAVYAVSCLASVVLKNGSSDKRKRLDLMRHILVSAGQIAIIIGLAFGNILDTRAQSDGFCALSACVRAGGSLVACSG